MVTHEDEGLIKAFVTATELTISKFKAQGVANTGWSFATAKHRDEELFAASASTVEQRLSEFNQQELANAG